MRTLLNHALKRVYLDNFARGLFRDFRATKRDIRWHYIRKFGRIDKEIIDNYLIKHQIRKLHIGCGKNILKDDWLNSDYRPWWHSILHLDATEAFPIPSETFDYIFSEHMIEHIPYSVGLEMLIECHRILKNNGKIRISTPDLKFLIDLYINDRLKLQSEYIKWSTDNFIENAPYYDGIFVLNNFVRDWGHFGLPSTSRTP
jgi:predicted SAM-dependent methyltransferase